MFSSSPLPSTTLKFFLSFSLYLYLHLLRNLSTLSIYNNHDIFKPSYLSISPYILVCNRLGYSPSHISFFIAITGMDLLRTTCFYFLFIVFVILSRTCLCHSRRLGPMEKKFGVNLDQLIAKNNEEITKLGAPSTNETKTLLSEAPIEHAVANHGQINGNSTKDDCRVKRDKNVPSKRVSKTWKVPKHSKKQPRSDQEHPAFNLDYMQPTTHPPHHN